MKANHTKLSHRKIIKFKKSNKRIRIYKMNLKI